MTQSKEEAVIEYLAKWDELPDELPSVQVERAFLAGCEFAEPKWISVSERLPREEDEYLVLPRKNHITAKFYPYDDFQESKNTALIKKNSWYRTDTHGFDYLVDVTHWMPLPKEPPPEARS